MKWLYDFIYRYEINAWDIGPRQELIDFIESGRIQPCRTIYLGSGTAKNAIYMAEHGFEVIGVDYSIQAIELGRKRARASGVEIEFIQDDLTNLRYIQGDFDFLVDFGTLDDLNSDDRALYVENILPLTHHESLFFLWCFEWPTRWRDKWNPLSMHMESGDVQRLFGSWFDIERIGGTANLDLSKYQPGTATYLMTHKAA